MTDEVSLRPVTTDDYSFMRSLYGDYRAGEMKMFPFNEEQKESFLDEQFAAQTAYYREHYPGADLNIIEEKGVSIGRLYVDRRTSEIRIMDIALVPAARNRGIGSALIRAILDEGRRTERPVTIHVEAFNPALRLYERLGFRKIDTNGVYFLLERKG